MQCKYIYFEETISRRAEKLNSGSSCRVCLPDSLIQTRLTRSNVNKRHWPPINVDASWNVRSNSCSLNRARCPHVWAHKLSFIASVLHWCCGQRWMSQPVEAQHWQGSISVSCLLWHTLRELIDFSPPFQDVFFCFHLHDLKVLSCDWRSCSASVRPRISVDGWKIGNFSSWIPWVRSNIPACNAFYINILFERKVN